jgi:hypothetical protein
MLDNRTVRALADGKFEETEHGLFVPTSRGFVVGKFAAAKRGEAPEISYNQVVMEGINYILGTALDNQTGIGQWYVAPFSGDVTVQSSWTASNFAATATEFTLYSAAVRPLWKSNGVAAGAINSFSQKAEIVSSTNGAIIRGASGVLLAASRFASAKSLDVDEILDIGYGLELQPA